MTMLHKLSGVAVALLLTQAVHAQGILTVTPGRAVATTAGAATVVGYSGNGGAATSATLALPSAVAYDQAGNLYIADANNHVVRLVTKATGVITTVAGTGVAGFSGDNGAATSAQLDTPTGVAVDGNGNIYIADSHNQRIREVSSGTITTIAGTGVAGYGGDGASATAALLSLPTGVAVGGSGTLYIADTNNQRIRRIAGGTIATVAGTGEQGYAGDGASATAALLDSPTAVAVDTAGDLFIADRHNQRIREVLATGTITTYAGSGTPTFGGGYGGDGASATAASLANPTGVSVDASGNVYIADSNNQRVRQVAGGAIASVVGTGAQDPTSLDSPRGVANDVSGNLALADTLNQRTQSSVLPTLTFPNSPVGIPSSTQTATLSNTGTAPITVSTISFAGPFARANGGSCSATPITLAAGASCTQNLVFVPTSDGAASGSVQFGGSAVVTQTVLLTGNATMGGTTVTLTSSALAPFINNPVTFTATVATVGGGTAPTGTVNFYINGSTTPFATRTLTAGSPTVSAPYTFTVANTYSISAVYTGDTNYNGSTGTLTQLVSDFSFDFSTAAGSSSSQSVRPGDTATFTFTASPLNGPFTFPISLTASGLPDGATVTFDPATVTLGSNPVNFKMSIKTAPLSAMLQRMDGFNGVAMALLLFVAPISRSQRRKGRSMHPLLLLAIGFCGLASMGALIGCGSNSGFFGQPQQTYTVTVVGTATDNNGQTLRHTTTVKLTVQ